jgi:hypothetical protein
MAISTDGSWLPGIGDATPVGWFTVLAYFAAAWLCWRVVSPRRLQRATMPTAQQRFWWVLMAAMAFLGINKQLDLQTAFTEIGRAVAQSGGWYEQRHKVQVVFIGLVGVGGVLALAALGWISRPLSRSRALALGGLVFLGSFVVIRAASFHHVDLLINATVFSLRWNWIVELSGIALVAGGAALAWRDAVAGRASNSASRPPLKAAFTPYRGPKTAAAQAAPMAAASPPPAAPPAPAAAARRPPRREFADDRPVRSPGDPRNR